MPIVYAEMNDPGIQTLELQVPLQGKAKHAATYTDCTNSNRKTGRNEGSYGKGRAGSVSFATSFIFR
jgi:hypothetical protein